MTTVFRVGQLVVLCAFACGAQAATMETNGFDGRPWNVSSGNLSVSFIQGSPIGAYPKTNYLEPAPSVESQARLRSLGLVANEDYVGWGAVEREEGQWRWEQHDAMEKNLHAAGLKYVAYNWVHFPPVWLREQKERRTLMRCLEHGEEANYLSIFDPRTIEWYDHFYRNLQEHFGERLDDVYACILGPYGEGNYPLYVPDWVNMGHCHEGYWCGDEFAIKAFQRAMKEKYKRISMLNAAWGRKYESFADVHPPGEGASGKFKPSPEVLTTARARRRWLDFMEWYDQAIIDFAEHSLKVVLKYFPAERVRMKPGGSSAGINPLAYGTYCPGYAKMAKPYHIVLQPADCQGAVFADKWMGTAYQFYGVTECTEPCGGLDDKGFARRMFSDASCGAAQLFTYEFEQHAGDIRKYIQLFTGKPGETEVAVYCPTTFHRLGGDLKTTIEACTPLRDLCEFDVLDDLLIGDAALSVKRYKALVVFQADFVEEAILEKMRHFRRSGGRIIVVGEGAIRNVAGEQWEDEGKVSRVRAGATDRGWLKELATELAGLKGVDGMMDGLWTCRRGGQVFVFNARGRAASTRVDGKDIEVAPYAIWVSSAAGK